MANYNKNNIAVWVITPSGVRLADILSMNVADVDVYVSQNIRQTTATFIDSMSASPMPLGVMTQTAILFLI